MDLLGPGDPHPVFAERTGSDARFLFVCDHAGRATPRSLGGLGLAAEAFDLHIAWDIGAGAVAQRLAAGFGASCFLQRYSRLVIDCNRDPARQDAIPAASDGVVIPGNQNLDARTRAARVEAIHAPYHAAVSAELDRRTAWGRPTVPIFVHSFTPRMAGVDRPWSFGVLHEGSSRFSRLMLDQLRALGQGPVGDNAPYAMDEVDYSAPTHALARGLDYLELEIRQDLIADEDGQARVADLLVEALTTSARRL